MASWERVFFLKLVPGTVYDLLGLSYTFPDPAGITNARCPGVQVSRLQQEETKHLQAVQANQRLEKDMAVEMLGTSEA